nr:unnamed protein product [Callosobruchus analis]
MSSSLCRNGYFTHDI